MTANRFIKSAGNQQPLLRLRQPAQRRADERGHFGETRPHHVGGARRAKHGGARTVRRHLTTPADTTTLPGPASERTTTTDTPTTTDLTDTAQAA